MKNSLAKIGTAATLALSLNACISLPGDDGGSDVKASSSTNAKAPTGSTSLSGSVISALCGGRNQEALDRLNAQPSSIGNLLLKAVALEKSGLPVKARNAYATVARSGNRQKLSVKCKAAPLRGSMVEVASKRLIALQRKLVELDMNFLASTTKLHDSLGTPTPPKPAPKSSGKTKSKKRDTKGLKLIALDVTLPRSHHPKGSWYAHLSSYDSYEDAVKYTSTLEKSYSALKGAINIWQISTANGQAFRLGVPVEQWSDADRLCVTIRSTGEYCHVLDRMK